MSLIEKHFRPAELADITGFSTDTIRSLFIDEPGVLVLARPEEMHKRSYSSIRIPASVAERVLAKYRVGSKKAA